MIPQYFLTNIANQHHLSRAEKDVLCLAMTGKSTKAIAQELSISNDAVRKRLSEIYQKFEIEGRGPVKLTKLQQLLVNSYQSNGNGSREPKIQRIDWYDAPNISRFYGRQKELDILESWIRVEKCRIVGIFGMGGIGKTALSVKLVEKIAPEFETVVWRSLNPLVSLQELLEDLCGGLSNPRSESEKTLDELILKLIAALRNQRCLVVLDSFDQVLCRGQLAGTYREGYAGYGQLLDKVGATTHQSCLIINSREKVKQISFLEGVKSPVKTLALEGLGVDSQFILAEKGLAQTDHWWNLIQAYRGNPVMLKLAAQTILELFDGNVQDFLQTTLFTRDVSNFIGETLGRLSALESEIVYQMASETEPLSISKLQGNLTDNSPEEVISAVASLKERSLLEKTDSGFTLTPIVKAVSRKQH